MSNLFTGKEGLEPPTPWFVATCSNPLSYKPNTRYDCSIFKYENFYLFILDILYRYLYFIFIIFFFIFINV